MKLLRLCTVITVVFLLFTTFVSTVQASAYGSGKYGAGVYNVGETAQSSSNNSSSSGPGCTDVSPGVKAPWLYGAIAQGGDSILLYFTQADDPVDRYVLQYGSKSGDYSWGSTNIGGKGIRTYLVRSLFPNTTYYFKVRGGNGCATGTWSNEISAKTKGLVSFNQLEITQSALEPKPVEEIPKVETCQTYTVKAGDTLWSIANNLLGEGNKYKEIIEQNKDKYPSFETSNTLNTGWELKVNCGGTQTPATEAQPQTGYDVKVKVVDTDKKPIEGAKVTIHSKVQEGKTDKDGIAIFHNVEKGEHKVLIAYNNYQGEETVNLTGEVKGFNLNVTVKEEAISLSLLAKIIIGVLILIILVLIVLLKKSRAKTALINK